jgi:hypothetical protein
MSAITILIPFHGKWEVTKKAIGSLLVQNNKYWEAILLPDETMAEDGEYHKTFREYAESLVSVDERISYSYEAFDRIYALKNIDNGMRHTKEGLVGIIDGDDYLSRDDVLSHVLSAYDDGAKIIWTDHHAYNSKLNCSGPYEDGRNPYRHPWVTSHFRCFDAKLYHSVPKANFKDQNGEWFTRCYDQALMLPMIHLAQQESIESLEYIPLDCYTYNDNFEVGGEGHQYQMQLENFIRLRGFVDED